MAMSRSEAATATAMTKSQYARSSAATSMHHSKSFSKLRYAQSRRAADLQA